ncbi:type II toxin-antitoxin system VapC family toxin [Desulforhabdus sp. TSK]|uniref:type II toxin-antitoxin system VapC family toxin n=1 Tax=Desulforhabdus sp. TSK TaxID=2925014 RepID=UPI001FC89512|nr:type II toxin-antitoxin system VapC family toxin [Desulforhabdus sp. TSK]GKT08900.1 twitching motility protein PilT [Desulforhabdus sp. TSK]
MIVLDTHIWVWWVHGDPQLTRQQVEAIHAAEADLIGVNAISVWEVAKLVEYNRLKLPCPLCDWFDEALSYPGVHLVELSPEIAIESTRLPGEFHRDPADQIIVATARIYDCRLVTSDSKILNYPYVKAIG